MRDVKMMTIALALGLGACAPPTIAEGTDTQSISCSQTFCTPNECVGTNCQHSLAADAQCAALACDDSVASVCQDRIASDALSCDHQCSFLLGTGQYEPCFEGCMNSIRHHCLGLDT